MATIEKEKNVLLTLSPNRAIAEIGWHRRQSGAYNDEYIDQIVDPSESVKKLLTAIPSPFARIHLVDSAFHFVNARDKQQTPKHEGNNVFHKLVSDCLDVLELLFNGNTLSTEVQTSYWSKTELQKLRSSKGQQLLASVLGLFLQEDAETAKFGLQPSFILLTVGHQTIALSSPLSLFITSPHAAEIAAKTKLLDPESGRPYFNGTVPLFKRSPEFQKYLHWLFQQNQVLQTACRRMYKYVTDSIELLADVTLQEKLRAIANGGADDLGQKLDPINDARGMPVTVCGVPLRQRKSDDMLSRLRNSPFAILSSRWPARLGNPPLVLDGQSDSFGKQSSIMQLASVAEDLTARILPDVGVRYPYLVASDLIDDQVIRLPYKLNSERFFLPDSRSLNTSSYDYLPPLKPAFFEYFDVKDISQITKFVSTNSGGVTFQIELPTRAGKVTLSKNFYESPEGAKRGRIVDAKMNCAVFPIVTTPEREALSDRYWVMLVDAEIEPALRNQECFALKFFSRQKNAEEVLYKEIGSDTNAAQHVSFIRRSPKGDEASSTYFRIRGGLFDYIAIEAFSNDPGRRSRGLIAPKWDERVVGTRPAAVGIDFGTTNTHVAWIYADDKKPNPAAFRVNSSELQIALLSAPCNSANAESAKYDGFDALSGPLRIGTKARLHHEFLPSIIGAGGSVFSFPLRTATCEAPNLQPGQYQPLKNVNIAFTFGLEAKRRGEEEIHTNLKWSLQVAPEVEKRVEAFIEQLLVMVRTKLILSNVDPEISRVVWFRPLSFNDFTKGHFANIWKTKVHDVLKTSQLRCITESEAPYYYHDKAAAAISKNPTICVDIGGGSTDVVFFHNDAPGFGTSFSFAGNALWGAGYDEIGKTQTGVVQKYAPVVGQRIQQIENADDRLRIAEVFQELQQGQPCEEIINFFFSIDKYVEFSKTLSRDPGVRCMVLLHYAAIMFHCAQIMQRKEMPEPEYICFSGRGARGLEILDPSNDHAQIAALTQALFEKVYGKVISRPMKVLLAADSKEATCNGGVLKSPTDMSEPETVVYVGDSKTIGEITYQQIDHATRDAVAANVAAFADYLLELSGKLGFSKKFGIKEGDFTWIASELKDKIADYIEFGLKRHGYHANPTEKINETLFFYPLVQKLFEIGNRLVVSDAAAKGAK
jgi:hypothetical protein